MKKQNIYFKCIVYPLIACFVVVQVPCASFAQEQITLTTYYPSPQGSYNELSVQANLNFANGAHIRGGDTLAGPFTDLITLSRVGGVWTVTFNVPVVFSRNFVVRGDLTVEGDLRVNGGTRLVGRVDVNDDVYVQNQPLWGWITTIRNYLGTLHGGLVMVGISGVDVASVLLPYYALIPGLPGQILVFETLIALGFSTAVMLTPWPP